MFLGYVDPGLGALVWQTAVSAFVGLLFYLNKTRKAIIGLLLKIFGRSKKPGPATQISTPKMGTEFNNKQ